MTENQESRGKLRLEFFDTIRFFIILFVILQHIALIFNTFEANTAISKSVYGYIVNITDVFMMPILFFIAGFFALPSLRRRGTVSFIKSKVHRIGLPWFTGVTLIVPIAVYINHYIRSVSVGVSPLPYFDYWLILMKSAGTFYTGFVTSPDQFSHRHLWFLSVLFPCFIVLGILHWISKKWLNTAVANETRKPSSDSAILTALVLLGLLSAAGFFTVKLFFRWGYQSTQILGLIHFDPSRLVVFIIYFSFGVYASSRKWFSGNRGLGRLIYWIPFCLIMFAVYIYLSYFRSLTMTTGVKFVFSFLRSFLCLSIFVVLMTYAGRFWNNPSPFTKKLASNSYYIYIIHYPIHAVSAVLLMNSTIYLPVRFLIVYCVTFIASYVVSQYVIKPFPRLSVLGLAVVNIVLFMSI